MLKDFNGNSCFLVVHLASHFLIWTQPKFIHNLSNYKHVFLYYCSPSSMKVTGLMPGPDLHHSSCPHLQVFGLPAKVRRQEPGVNWRPYSVSANSCLWSFKKLENDPEWNPGVPSKWCADICWRSTEEKKFKSVTKMMFFIVICLRVNHCFTLEN